MTCTFLFWNLGKRPLQTFVRNIALKYRVDVLILTECLIPPAELLRALNPPGGAEYDYAPGTGCEKIEIFSRFSGKFILPVLENHRLTIRHLNLPGLTDILLAAVHFPGKRDWSESSQAAECSELSYSVRLAEGRIGHSGTVLVGDLNMNPFDAGVVNANGLNGVMCQRIARRKKRTVQSRRYPFFYNPMWNLLGDSSPGPPGTYYYPGSEHTAFFWHIFDQVLIRPDLLKCFSNADLEILCSDGETSFLSPKGLPDRKVASDHLPILFKLNL